MIRTEDLISPAEYRRVLQPHLPEGAFAPAPRKLGIFAAHLLVILCGYAVIRFTDHWLVWLGATLVIGHSIACIAFLTHELSHGTIVASRRLRYGLELLFWGLNFISPTVWRRIHNQTHHHHTNTPEDNDRRFLATEASASTRWYTRLFFPNRQSPRWNLLVGLHFVTYILRNTIGAFLPNQAKLAISPSRPPYTPAQRVRVALELVAIALLQATVFYAAGGSWERYFFASPLAVFVTSAVVMAYVFTNHFLNPICESTDPLAGSTSVIVPRIFDRFHSHFSYHTEHHLFPGMNSDHYPAVGKLLQEIYGERYHRIAFAEAWRLLWRIEPCVAEDEDSERSPNFDLEKPVLQGSEKKRRVLRPVARERIAPVAGR